MTPTLLGKPLSRVGLGCARLTGWGDRKRSVQVIEMAIECGITHFDTAPSYGFGASEALLGSVIGADPRFTVATKVGIPRPAHGRALALARRFVKPIAQRLPSLKQTTMKVLAAQGASQPPLDPRTIQASFDDSRRALRRDWIDIYLLHEPSPASLLNPQVTEALERLVTTRSINAYGIGIQAQHMPQAAIGKVEQSLWLLPDETTTRQSPRLGIRHGLLRHYLPIIIRRLASLGHSSTLSERLGADVSDPVTLASIVVTAALALSPSEVMLVSSNDPTRLRTLITGIDWGSVQRPSAAYLQVARELFSLVLATHDSSAHHV